METKGRIAAGVKVVVVWFECVWKITVIVLGAVWTGRLFPVLGVCCCVLCSRRCVYVVMLVCPRIIVAAALAAPRRHGGIKVIHATACCTEF